MQLSEWLGGFTPQTVQTASGHGTVSGHLHTRPACGTVIATDSAGAMHHLTRVTACAVAVDNASAAADVC